MPVCLVRQNLVNGMETSTVTSSFLCCLPELECIHTNMVYPSGVTETNGEHHFSTKPPSLMKKNDLNQKVGSPRELVNASAEVCSDTGNPLVGCFCQREVLEIGGSAVSPVEQPYLVTRTAFQSSNQGELRSLKVAECQGRQDFSQGMAEEEDVLAFEITEFFNAFKDGKEHNFAKLREKWNLASPDQRGSNDLGSISNLKTTEGQASTGKQGMPRNEESTDGGVYSRFSSAGRSGKWNGLEPDSFSTTFSGPLTFSGPISLSGHAPHTPHSGSVSHRSDSSTASAHSFAFPILPCEWNSSPVKMPQPDKKYTEKRWKQHLHNFFCCCNSLD